MNSIGAFSPRAFLQEQLNSQISVGQIKSSDKGALTSAFDQIGASLGGPPTGKPNFGDMASKVDGLISEREKSGKLTSEQASELRAFFESVKKGAPGSASAPGAGFGSIDNYDVIDEFLKLINQSNQNAYTSNGVGSSSFTSMLLDIET